MKWIHGAGIAASLFVSLLLTGCGDVYRPVVDPFQNPGADPQTSATAFVLSQGVTAPPSCANPPCQGSVSQIDVPGDVNMGVKSVGVAPWHIYATFSAAYVANRESGNLSAYSPFLGASSTVSTISLPAGTQPTYVNTTQTDAVYVALRSTSGAPGSVGVVVPGTNQLTQTVPVGIEPVALVETPDRTKLYVVNKNGTGSGVGTVTAVATLDKKVVATITVGVAPVFAIATTDSKYVFVLNRGSNSVSVISTATNQNLGNIPVGSSADVTDIPLSNPMYFDSRQQRLYVVNSNDGTISAFDTSALPTLPTPVAGSPLKLFQLGAPAPNPVSVVALSDGSRAYVANSATNTVTVVNARSMTVTKSIPVGVNPVGLAVSADNTKVYAINRGDPATPPTGDEVGTSVIRTSDDTVVLNILPPYQDAVKCTAVPWAPNTAYGVNSFVIPKAQPNGHVFQATNAGTTGSLHRLPATQSWSCPGCPRLCNPRRYTT
jgi:YVTN family beta-propeller protein